MKKIKYIILLLLMLIPTVVLAKGSINVSTSTININKGGSKTFVVTASNCAGKINISSSNSSIVSASESSIFLDMQSATITLKANQVGTATITVYNQDVTTYDDEDISGRSSTITVNVTEVQSTPSTPSTPALSTNNDLKLIEVPGYNLEKIDDLYYSLKVGYEVESIEINAVSDDELAKVSGSGNKTLNVGENNFEVVVTSQANTTKTYTVKVTRNDSYYLEDINTVLNNDSIEDKQITIKDGDTLSSSYLQSIKDNNYNIKFNYYDNNKLLLYTISYSPDKIKDITDSSLIINNTSDNKDKISKLSNYSEGIILNYKNSNNVDIRYYVGDKYNNGDILNIYGYNEDNNTLDNISKVEVIDGYINFELSNNSDYLITMATLNEVSASKNNLSYMILSILELVIIFGFVLIFYLKYKKNKIMI